MSNRPDGSYATKDLFLRHPHIPNAFRFIGRADDTLVHGTWPFVIASDLAFPPPLIGVYPSLLTAVVSGEKRTRSL